MENHEDDEKLIQGFDKNANLDIDSGNKSCNKKKIIIIVSAIVLLIVVVVIVLVFTVFKKNSSNTNKDSDSDSSTDEPSDKGKDDKDDSTQSVLDTIPQEEMDKARNAFKQYTYIDSVNSSYVLNYNLFTPENYTPEKKYPLLYNYFYT